MADRPSRKITGFGFRNGRVYILTSFGVGVYNPVDSVFIESYFRFGPVPQDTPVNAVAFLNDRIWLGTDKGLVYASADAHDLATPDSWQLYTLAGNDSVSTLAVHDDSLFVGTDKGAYVVDAAGFHLRSDLPQSRVVIATYGDNVAAATTNDLYRYESGSFRIVAVAPDNVRDVAIAGNGQIGAGLNRQGLALMEGESLTIKLPNAPAGNLFEDLTLADDGALWIAHAGYGGEQAAGVSRFKGERWERYGKSNPAGLQSDNVCECGSQDKRFYPGPGHLMAGFRCWSRGWWDNGNAL